MTAPKNRPWWLLIGILPIRLYQLTLSPFIGFHCRYQPTCSAYGIEAIERHGLIKGVALTLRRLGRCHPWGGSGHDPVPGPRRDKGHADHARHDHSELCSPSAAASSH